MKKNFYSSIKYISISGMILISILYFFLYFKPSIEEIKSIKSDYSKKRELLKEYEGKLLKFKPPTENEKKLWKSIEEKYGERFKTIKTKKEVLKFMLSSSEYIFKLLKERNIVPSSMKVVFEDIEFMKSLGDKGELSITINSLLEREKPEETRKLVFKKTTMGERIVSSENQNEISYIIIAYTKLINISDFLRKITLDSKGFVIHSVDVKKEGDKKFYRIEIKYPFKGYENVEK